MIGEKVEMWIPEMGRRMTHRQKVHDEIDWRLRVEEEERKAQAATHQDNSKEDSE